MMPFFLKGGMIGFAIAAPVGPIGVLCIRRALMNGRISGFATGAGAAVADGFYGAVAAFGLTAVSAFLGNYSAVLRLAGGLFLLGLAAQTLRRKPDMAEAKDGERRIHGLWDIAADFSSTVFLTLTNPATILSFIAVFAGLGLGLAKTPRFDAVEMVAGVFSGSLTWWLILSFGIGAVRHKLDGSTLALVNRISAAIIGGFGVAALASLL